MANMRVRTLFVLTLLQLCRAEISDSLPESWYSANVINDGFQPKPISEIFSTEPPFSTTNPIVVLPKQSTSVPDDILLLSTLEPPRKISTTGASTTDFTKTSVIGLQPSTPPTVPSTFPTTPSTTADISTPQQSTSSQSSQTQSQQIRLELVPQGQNLPEQPVITLQQSQTSTVGPLSNYFLIYQQAPQSIQGFPGTTQEVPQFTTAAPPTTQTLSTLIIQSNPTVSPQSTLPPTSTTPLPSTVRVQTTPIRNCQNATFVPTTPRSLGDFPLRIRVVAPSGSITNVNFNPTTRTTTTRRPTTVKTRRTNKPKRNNYESCTDGCKGRRQPICAAPLSTTFLDPNTLKGFPSVCHMACHNSYRKESYEKVLDGRCGRLRTRIKTVDSNTKLKRDELNKAQYFLDNSGTKTIVEFSGLN